jgi:hypothetical protein
MCARGVLVFLCGVGAAIALFSDESLVAFKSYFTQRQLLATGIEPTAA